MIIGGMFLILFAAKVFGFVAWSWWIIFAPLFAVPIFFLLILLVGITAASLKS